ncbi:MAG TPA: outer membrane beta-barrel protein [Bryobacteraceae bacterium]|nr:outer membrane beta-barrel protein [Bryobacteraceae bacterium]
MTKNRIGRTTLALIFLAVPALAEEHWDIGFAAGYGFYKNVTATNATGKASVGFRPGVAFAAHAGNEMNRWLAGEARYTYRQNDAWVSARGTEARFDADSHILTYDLIFHLAGRPAHVRPFLAAGAGAKIYRGAGREAAFQPLSNFVALTRATQAVPVASAGGGFKIEMNRLITLRVEARDYASPLPRDVVTPVPGARVHGWVHDIVPMIGISFNVGR